MRKSCLRETDFKYPPQPIPLHFAEKAAFREKRFITKVLDPTPKLPISIPLVRLFPRKVGKRPNSIPIYSFEVKSALNPTSKDKLFFITHSAHSPAFRRKSSISGKALHYRGLGHNSKASDFHSTCPPIPGKNREAAKLHFNLQL